MYILLVKMFRNNQLKLFWINFQSLSHFCMISRLSVLVLIFFSSFVFSDVENPCKAVFVEKKKELNAELVESVENKDIKKVKSLLKQGAEANSADEEGTTVLMLAGLFGYIEIVELLILEGADMNATDIYGDTALIQAVFSKKWEVVEILWENGADVSVKNKFGDTALSWAKRHEDPDMIEYLEEKIKELVTEEEKKLKFPKTLLSASRKVRKAGIVTIREYHARCKKLSLPYNPNIYYKSDWKSWSHFLGIKKKGFPETLLLASEIARGADIRTSTEYYARSKELGLPFNPDRHYRIEWQGWSDFLGKKKFPTFLSAREIVKEADITKKIEYLAMYRELGLPSEPDIYYKSEWQSWPDFLGTRRAFPETLLEASRKAREAGITTRREYYARSEELGFVPYNPNEYYKDEWQGWPDFLGTRRDLPETLLKASRIAREAGITTKREYYARSGELDLPSNPNKYYKDEWQGWPDFLGTRRAFPKTLLKASRKARKAGIKTREEYHVLYKELRLPYNPNEYYKEEWQGWPDFLGTRRDFPETLLKASEIAREAGIKTREEYHVLCKKLGLPSNPNEYYKEEWQGWLHFLGTGKNFPAFEVAIQRVQQAGIATSKEYKARYKELGLPSNPNKYYKSEWQSWPDFLGARRAFPKTLLKASEIAREAGIKTREEYQVLYKGLGLPSAPNKYYKSEWQSWPDFLGTRRAFPKTLLKASEIAREAGITTKRKYRIMHKELALPVYPEGYYKSDWQGWGHFLGTGRIKRDFPETLLKASRIVREAGITTERQYRSLYRELGLPANPDRYYKLEWQSWAHFLGTKKDLLEVDAQF